MGSNTFGVFLPMQFLDETEMTVKELRCTKCNARLGRIIDDVYLCIGDARFFCDVRFSCSCGKPIYFKTRSFEITGFKSETKKILNELGYKDNFRKQRNRKKG